VPNTTEFPWQRVSPEIRQSLGDRLRTLKPVLHAPIPLLYALGIGVCFFLLPYVLWWLTSTLQAPVPARASEGLELHQLLQALQAALGESTQGQSSSGGSAPFAPREAEVAVHFVVQPSVPPSGDTTYRLVPVDMAHQPRPEHVQTLTMRLTPASPSPYRPGTSLTTGTEVWPPKDGDPLPPARPKKRTRS
jgi:hypothetical protein